jgi:2-polyprenyl-3-methyl-5-hydroxy-6-metoxy-1,4-benzoquinol methylase
MTQDSPQLDCLLPLMRAKGVTISPARFHDIVNVTFHRFESRHYDTVHREMWDVLPAQFELLTNDLLDRPLPESLDLLDIGCGTGLSSELLLATPLGKKIAQLDLIDTSAEMLAKCRERAARWPALCRFVEGTVEQAPGARYDLILTCSVLHHIPDLRGFLRNVRALQAPGGFFIHLQDPNGDCLADPDLLRRSDALRRTRKKSVSPLRPALRIASRIRRAITGARSNQPKNYLAEVNDALLAEGVIKIALTDEEIWSVTDIHESNLPYSTGSGISIRSLREMMPDYELVSARSYSFFGRMMNELPGSMKKEELRLIRERAMNGSKLAAAWRCKS